MFLLIMFVFSILMYYFWRKMKSVKLKLLFVWNIYLYYEIYYIKYYHVNMHFSIKIVHENNNYIKQLQSLCLFLLLEVNYLRYICYNAVSTYWRFYIRQLDEFECSCIVKNVCRNLVLPRNLQFRLKICCRNDYYKVLSKFRNLFNCDNSCKYIVSSSSFSLGWHKECRIRYASKQWNHLVEQISADIVTIHETPRILEHFRQYMLSMCHTCTHRCNFNIIGAISITSCDS